MRYDSTNKILTLDNATIESEDTVVYSMIDLHIQLIGENKVVCTNEEYCVGVYAGNYNLNKDLALVGDGSLTIEFPNARVDAAGLSAADLTIGADLTVITPDCENAVNGIICDSSLILLNKAVVTVNGGAAKFIIEKTKGRRVFLRYDSLKYDSDNVLLGYLYLDNKTFINAHLLKHGLADVDTSMEYKYKSRFITYSYGKH